MAAAPTAHRYYTAIVATPTDIGPGIMRSRFEHQCDEGRWGNRDARLIFRVFWLLDGKRDHLRLGELLHRSEDDIRHAFVFLKADELIEYEMHRKELPVEKQPLNTELLAESFALIKPHGEMFAHSFYNRLFATGRALYGTSEIEDLFKQTDMQKQREALLGALSFVVANVVVGKNITGDLAELGARHRGYGVKDEYYGVVGDALIASLQAYFNLATVPMCWNQELYETWLEAYTMVSSAMMNAETA